MTRISVARRVIGEAMEVHVSSGEPKTQDEQTGIVSVLGESFVLRVKPDRRSVDKVMPTGSDRRRAGR